jgi:hypothetical protein
VGISEPIPYELDIGQEGLVELGDDGIDDFIVVILR